MNSLLPSISGSPIAPGTIYCTLSYPTPMSQQQALPRVPSPQFQYSYSPNSYQGRPQGHPSFDNTNWYTTGSHIYSPCVSRAQSSPSRHLSSSSNTSVVPSEGSRRRHLHQRPKAPRTSRTPYQVSLTLPNLIVQVTSAQAPVVIISAPQQYQQYHGQFEQPKHPKSSVDSAFSFLRRK